MIQLRWILCLIGFSVFQHVCNSWSAYRVVAVTDHENDPNKADFERSVSASSYCYPRTKIYLSSIGFEDPDCSSILIVLERSDKEGYLDCEDIRFIYDGGEYVGVLGCLKGWAEAHPNPKIGVVDAMISDISSL